MVKEYYFDNGSSGERNNISPESPLLKVYKNKAIALATAPAVLHAHIALPEVAVAVMEHSKFTHGVLGKLQRLHSTVTLNKTLAFGTVREAQQAANKINRRHALVQGNMPQKYIEHGTPSTYSAIDTKALKWVGITTLVTNIKAHELLVSDMPPEEKDQAIVDGKKTISPLGVEESMLPSSWEEANNYINLMVASKRVRATDIACQLSKEIFNPTWFETPVITAHLNEIAYHVLPKPLVEQYALGNKNEDIQVELEAFAGSLNKLPEWFVTSRSYKRMLDR